VITFSVNFNPEIVFTPFLKELKLKGQLIGSKLQGALILASNVLPISKQKFIEIAENIHAGFISKRHIGDDPVLSKI
jgi:hypothetical protein